MAINSQQGKWLSAKQLAALLEISLRTVWRLRDREQLPPPVMVGGLVRWVEADIQRWMKAGCPGKEERDAAGTASG